MSFRGAGRLWDERGWEENKILLNNKEAENKRKFIFHITNREEEKHFDTMTVMSHKFILIHNLDLPLAFSLSLIQDGFYQLTPLDSNGLPYWTSKEWKIIVILRN